MPPRYAYWTIIAGGLPTAFRAADRDELLPTFQRIREKHPDAQMKYFARGKLWESQDAARAAQARGGARNRGGERHARPGEAGRERDRRPGPRPDEAGREKDRRPGARPDEAGRERERRSRDWRPGGDHRDPRQKFVDAKKQRNASIRQERWQRKNAAGGRSQGSGVKQGQGNSREGDGTAGKRFEGKRPEGRKPEGRRPEGKSLEGKSLEGKRPDWKKPDWKKRPEARWRPAGKKPWMQKPWTRSQGTEEPTPPPRPQGPNREPRPDEEPKPTPPPKPEQPITPAPGPPERGLSRRPFRPAGKYPKGPRKA